MIQLLNKSGDSGAIRRKRGNKMKNKIGYTTFKALAAGIVVIGLVGAPSASYAASKAIKVTPVKNTVATKAKAALAASKSSSDAVSAALAAFRNSADSLVNTIDLINNPVVETPVDSNN
jgi:hypothetical protein